MDQPKIVDVTTDTFKQGVTNFTFENLFDALMEAGNPEGDVTVKMHPALYRRCHKCDMLDEVEFEGIPQYQIQGMGIDDSNEQGKVSGQNLFETLILNNGEVVAVLRTREA